MDIKGRAIKFVENLLRGSSVFEGDELCLGGKAVHNDHDRCKAIGFVERAGEVYN